jgi:TonB family protein
MKYILTFLLFLSFGAFAQQDTTLVYNSPMYTKDPVRSKWKPVAKRVGEFFQVSFYDRKGVLKEVISFEDKNLTVRKGPYTFYTGTNIATKGNYDKGHKHGEWTIYGVVGTDVMVRRIENYFYGKLHDKYTENWPNQKIKNQGLYENGRKIGEWKTFYKDGSLAGSEIYDVYGKKTGSEYFFKDGSPAKYEDLFAKPTYKGGMQAFYQYLSETIIYPKQAQKDKISGTVHVSFTIKTDGSVENVEAVKSPDFELSDEAIRIVRKSTDWIPGKDFGEAVNVKFTIPIKFSLPRM